MEPEVRNGEIFRQGEIVLSGSGGEVFCGLERVERGGGAKPCSCPAAFGALGIYHLSRELSVREHENGSEFCSEDALKKKFFKWSCTSSFLISPFPDFLIS